MPNRPTGIVTFLFTDIEGSTRLSQEFPDTLPAALEIHNNILKNAIESRNGFIFDITGDAFFAAFQNADDAVISAVEIQKKLSVEKWKDAVIKIRIGIHCGYAEWNDSGYAGYITLARVARIMSSAYGEQIIISDAVYENISEKNTGISFRDLGKRRLKDVIKPIRLFQVKAPGLREDFPPLKTLDARPNNLPVQLTSFIGREEEMKTIKELLKSTSLLTLTGSGGAGKTRLALQTGADLIDLFANGVWFAELATTTDPELLPQALTGTFKITEDPQKTLSESLTEFLKDKEILLILDNCEQIIDACSELAEKLISSCEKLKIIATSREALRCTGEQVFLVPSLMLPDPSLEYTPENLTQYESVRLFIERALAVNPAFTVNNENAPALAGICSRLDGIPLAIELAAARTNILTVEKIYERLDDRFNLLSAGKRTSLPRQQTLKALIDWSYGLLSENEKLLWSRLSVFSGGWTIEAAEEICSDDTLSRYEILNLLSQLVEKSIILFDEANGRYRILETIKQYGRENLKSSGNILSRHLDYYLKIFGQADIELAGSDSKAWLDKLSNEQINLQTAIEWSLENEEVEKGTRLAAAINPFWELRGNYFTGRRLLKRILENAPLLSDFSKAKALHSAGVLAEAQGDFEEAKKLYNEGLDLNRKTGNDNGIADCLMNLGNVALYQGDHAVSWKYYDESLAIYSQTGNHNGIADCLLFKGILENNQGNYDNAKKLCEESREYRDENDLSGISRTIFLLGDISWKTGEYDQAKKYFYETMEIHKTIGDKRGIASSFSRLGNISFELGDYEKAKKFSEESIRIHREIGNNYGIVTALNTLGILAMVQGEYKEAKKIFSESLELRRETGDKYGIANTINNLGITAFYQGEYLQAKDLFEESLNIRREIGDKEGIGIAVNCLGRVFYQLGEFEESKKLLRESLDLRRKIGESRWIADSINKLGIMIFYQGEQQEAEKLISEGLALSRRAGVKIGIAESLINMGCLLEYKGNINQAKEHFEEGLLLYRELKNKYGMALSLINIAGIIKKNNDPSGAAIILGSSDSVMESIGGVLEIDQRKKKEEILNGISEELGDKEVRKLLEEGSKLNLDKAIDLALSDARR